MFLNLGQINLTIVNLMGSQLTINFLEISIMTVSKNHINTNRNPDDINMLIQDVSDSFLTFISSKVNPTISSLVERLKTLELDITTQIMHTLEAPLDKHDFRDLVQQLISTIMDDLLEKAYSTSILSIDESKQIKSALNESIEMEFCKIYNPSLKY